MTITIIATLIVPIENVKKKSNEKCSYVEKEKENKKGRKLKSFN